MFGPRNAYLLTAAGSLLHAKALNLASVASLSVVVLGAVGYVMSDKGFQVRNMAWVFAYGIANAAYPIVTKLVIKSHVNMTSWGRTYYNNLMTFLVFIPVAFIAGEHRRVCLRSSKPISRCMFALQMIEAIDNFDQLDGDEQPQGRGKRDLIPLNRRGGQEAGGCAVGRGRGRCVAGAAGAVVPVGYRHLLPRLPGAVHLPGYPEAAHAVRCCWCDAVAHLVPRTPPCAGALVLDVGVGCWAAVGVGPPRLGLDGRVGGRARLPARTAGLCAVSRPCRRPPRAPVVAPCAPVVAPRAPVVAPRASSSPAAAQAWTRRGMRLPAPA